MSVVWPFEPNWASPVNESLEWSTNVLRAYNGTEKRLRLRSIARRRLAYDFLVRRADTQLFDNLLWGRQNQAFVVPYWQYKEKTTAPVSIGATSIPVDTSTAGYTAGQSIVIFLNALVNEVLTIASVTTGHVIVEAPGTVLAWAQYSKVYPASFSLFESNVPVNRHTSSLLEGTATFLAEPISTDPFVPTTDAPDTYNGIEVILQQPDWVNAIDSGATFNFDVADYGTGDRLSAVTEINSSLAFKYRWLLKTRPLINEFRAFLGRRQGQFNTFYLPSWHEDFTLVANITSIATTITVVDRFFSLYVGINPARADLFIRTRAHGNFLRQINSFVTSGANVVLSIGSALGVAVPISDIISISYLCQYRKVVDLTTLQWQTDRVAVVEDTFQLVAA
jgi:hypothetical protein